MKSAYYFKVYRVAHISQLSVAVYDDLTMGLIMSYISLLIQNCVE
jgi:hypothetical protein